MRIMNWLAQTTIKLPGGRSGDIGYSGVGSGDTVLTNVLTMVYMWAGIIAIIVIIVSGLFFVTARGDAGQMKRSKDALRGAVVGLVVVMVAFVITRFIIGWVQA